MKIRILLSALLLVFAAPAGPAAPDVSLESPQFCAQELFAAVGPFHRPPENSRAWVHEVYCETVARELANRWVREHPEWMKR